MDYPVRSALTSTLPARLAQSSQRNLFFHVKDFLDYDQRHEMRELIVEGRRVAYAVLDEGDKPRAVCVEMVE